MRNFSADRYNELPCLEQAVNRQKHSHVDGLIEGPLRDVFISHNVHGAFALYLQHRHHQVGPNEAVVKVHSTAHLMNEEAMRDIEKFGNKIVPATWMTSDLLPMEFAVVPASTEVLIPNPELVSDIRSLLASHGSEGLFGISAIEEEDWAEITIDNASVVVPNSQAGTGEGVEAEPSYIPVAFVFDDKRHGFRVHGKCGKNHKHTSKPA